MKSCLIIAGEKSGEEHAMSFFPELRKHCPQTQFFGVGGEHLQEQGVELLYHLKDFSSMGFSEVIRKIPFYFKALKILEEEVVRRGTKTAILIDFQDFNLRLAQRLSRRGVKVLYYVAPQAWVWKPNRAQVLARTVHTLFSILPFEKEWFAQRGVKQIRGIPHPLTITYKDQWQSIPPKAYGDWNKSEIKILLLPGSRRFEVELLLPEFISTIRELRKSYRVKVHLVKVPHLSSELYGQFEDDYDVVYDSTELVTAMKECHFALAASGTVTLSTGLFELPTVVAYKGSLLNEFIFHQFIRYQGPASLTNIIHQRWVFPEFLQERATHQNMIRPLRTWIENESAYNEVKATLKKTKDLLSGEDFSVAQYMAQVINEN